MLVQLSSDAASIYAAATDVSGIAEGLSRGTPQQSAHAGSDYDGAVNLDLEETIIDHGECE